MSITDLSRAKSALIQLCAIYPGNYWSLAIEAYMAAVGIEMEGLKHDVRQAEAAYEAADDQLAEYREQTAMYQQNERAYAIREKELQDQNDALRSANSSIHTARLDSLTDIQNLKEQVRKLAMDVQGLMNPIEIIDAPDCFNPTCECNSCKWERHNAAKKVTHPTDTNGYGVVGRPRDGD